MINIENNLGLLIISQGYVFLSKDENILMAKLIFPTVIFHKKIHLHNQ